MATTDFIIGDTTTTSIKIAIKSDATGPVTLTWAGGVIGPVNPAAADTTVNDGWVYFNVTGLSPNTLYNFSDGTLSGSARTYPSSGMLRIGFASCPDPSFDNFSVYAMLEDAIIAAFLLGDVPYANAVVNKWGINATGVDTNFANSKDVTVYYAAHLQMHRMPALKALFNTISTYKKPDDHERVFDNPSPTDLTGYQTEVPGAGAATQTDLDDAWEASQLAIDAYSLANPADSVAGYFKKTIGNCEIFAFDCVRDRSPVGDADGPLKLMLSAPVEAALIADVLASTAKFKIIATPKELYPGGINTDTWPFYATQRDRILDALKNVTTLVWIAGDAHLPNIQFAPATASRGDTFVMVACPMGQLLNAAQGDPAGTDHIVWKRGSSDNLYPVGFSSVYALADVYDDKLILSLRDVFAGSAGLPAGTLQSYTFIEGSNIPLEFGASSTMSLTSSLESSFNRLLGAGRD